MNNLPNQSFSDNLEPIGQTESAFVVPPIQNEQIEEAHAVDESGTSDALKVLGFVILAPIVVISTLVISISVLMVTKPQKMISYFGYQSETQSLASDQSPNVLGVSTIDVEEEKTQDDIIAEYLKIPANLSVQILAILGNKEASNIYLPEANIESFDKDFDNRSVELTYADSKLKMDGLSDKQNEVTDSYLSTQQINNVDVLFNSLIPSDIGN